jgi:diacylglycerol kinase
MAMEIINTAIEKTIDLICPEQNPTAGLIKDIAAAAVLVMSICSLVIGILIFGKYLF